MSELIKVIDELISLLDDLLYPQDTVEMKLMNRLPKIRGFFYYPSNTNAKNAHAPTIHYRFDYESIDSAKQFLLQNGFVVFKNVINKNEINTAKELFWKWISEINIGWDRNDPSTWTNQTFPGYTKTGVLYKKGVGQNECQWYLRTRLKLLNIWTSLWNETSYKNLLTSYDGIGIYRPWNDTNTEYKTREQWFHVDQHYNELPHFDVYQGLISLQEQNEFTGGTVVIPRSHLVFKKATEKIKPFFKKLPLNHWILDDRNNTNKYNKLLVNMECGDLLIWDGRTIHCNTYPLKDINDDIDIYDTKQNEFNRMVSYIAMSPKSKIKKLNVEDYTKYRLKAYRDKTTTGHWPHKVNITDTMSSEQLDTVKRNDFQSMTETIKSLVGCDEDKPEWFDQYEK